MKCVTPCEVKVNDRIESVPCGICFACAQTRRSHWSSRLYVEWQHSKYSYFYTLTYADENLTFVDDIPVLLKSDVQKFLKRLRKRFNHFRIRYFLCGEYGGLTRRPHYHILLFSTKKLEYEDVRDTWQLGNVKCGNVTMKSIMYCAKYSIVDPLERKFYEMYDGAVSPPFCLMSRRPGIGYQYLKDGVMEEWHNQDLLNRTFVMIDGQKRSIPRFYRDKIYSAEDKERIRESYKLIKESVKRQVSYRNEILFIKRKQAEYINLKKSVL